ncbi:unnamed protein product [Sympodiomycopsis kandeliae]
MNELSARRRRMSVLSAHMESNSTNSTVKSTATKQKWTLALRTFTARVGSYTYWILVGLSTRPCDRVVVHVGREGDCALSICFPIKSHPPKTWRNIATQETFRRSRIVYQGPRSKIRSFTSLENMYEHGVQEIKRHRASCRHETNVRRSSSLSWKRGWMLISQGDEKTYSSGAHTNIEPQRGAGG